MGHYKHLFPSSKLVQSLNFLTTGTLERKHKVCTYALECKCKTSTTDIAIYKKCKLSGTYIVFGWCYKWLNKLTKQNQISLSKIYEKYIKPWNWWGMTRRRRILPCFLSHAIIVVKKANWMVRHISFFWSFNVRENRGRQHIWVGEIRFPCFVCTTLFCIVPKILLLLLLWVQIIEITLLGRRWLIGGQVGLLAHRS